VCQEPWLVDISRLSRSEAKLFRATCERVRDVVAEEGHPVELWADAMPLMFICSTQLWPNMRRMRRVALLSKTGQFLAQAIETFHAEPGGHA